LLCIIPQNCKLLYDVYLYRPKDCFKVVLPKSFTRSRKAKIYVQPLDHHQQTGKIRGTVFLKVLSTIPVQLPYHLNTDSQIDGKVFFFLCVFVVYHMGSFLLFQNVTVFLSEYYFIISHTEKSITTEPHWKFIIKKITNTE